MAQHAGDGHAGTAVELSAGSAVLSPDRAGDPGLPQHHHRLTDRDPKAAKRVSRQVTVLFWLSGLASIFSVVAYIWLFPIVPGDMLSVRLNTTFVGGGIALALLLLGFGIIHYTRQLMVDTELVEERHPIRSDEAVREEAVEILETAGAESGLGRRALIRNSLIGAGALSVVPAVALFRDLAPAEEPLDVLARTLWKRGERLTRDPSGIPIKASDVTLGSVFHVIPESLKRLHGAEMLNEKAKAIVLLMRLKPEDLTEAEDRKTWSYNGIVAYSKVCTHVGCPVALAEQQTHHLLCPCHQSTFDIADGCRVVFGPAKRPLPQLPITVDAEGYLVAQNGFSEPVGPSYWERAR